jgi:hypothetical protein
MAKLRVACASSPEAERQGLHLTLPIQHEVVISFFDTSRQWWRLQPSWKPLCHVSKATAVPPARVISRGSTMLQSAEAPGDLTVHQQMTLDEKEEGSLDR